MKRVFLTLLSTLLFVATLSAQSPEIIREKLKANPDYTLATYTTYPTIDVAQRAKAPKGFSPFYLSTVNRHGSRYQNTPNANYFVERITTLRKLEQENLLTELGKRILKYMCQAEEAQHDKIGELSPLGAKQLYEMGQRADDCFGEIFSNGGKIVGITSTYNRCKESMQNFVKGIKERNPDVTIDLSWDDKYQAIVRPYNFSKAYDKAKQEAFKHHATMGEWLKSQEAWANSHECKTSLAKIVTDVDLAIEKVGIHPFLFGYEMFSGLLFMQNFEIGERDLHTQIFSAEDMYAFYVYKAFNWNCTRACEGMAIMDIRHAHIRPLVEDIINQAERAIEGKDKVCANLRFTHDTNVMPLLSALKINGTRAIYTGDVESCAVSTFVSEMIPMAANLQFVFYRNAKGEVLVRILLNESDATVPIEGVAPHFYRWEALRNYMVGELAMFDRRIAAHNGQKSN